MLQDYTQLPNIQLTQRQNLPDCSAIYFAIAREQVLYIGLAQNLRNRWQNHHRLPQLEAINKRLEVRLFWLSCDRLFDIFEFAIGVGFSSSIQRRHSTWILS